MKYQQGDLIDLFKKGQFDLILHQCNCFGIGAGIAHYLFQEFPVIKQSYEYDSQTLFGEIDFHETPYGTIVNCFSQFKPGGCSLAGIDSFRTRCAVLESNLKTLNGYSEFKGRKIGLPLIASGLASYGAIKKNKTDLEYFQEYIAPIVEKSLTNLDVTIVYR